MWTPQHNAGPQGERIVTILSQPIITSKSHLGLHSPVRQGLPIVRSCWQTPSRISSHSSNSFLITPAEHTMIPRLPAETFNAIVDHLHDNDRSALVACSLASSVFVVSARHRRFSEIFLECSHICTLLDVPWCRIATAVKRVSIGQRRKTPGWNHEKPYRVPGLSSFGLSPSGGSVRSLL
jgi:hypothetical protein